MTMMKTKARERIRKVTKRTNIFNKLKANLTVLLLVCFAALAYSGVAYAENVDLPQQNFTAYRPFRPGVQKLSVKSRIIRPAVPMPLTANIGI